MAVQVEITDNCNQRCSHCYRSCQIVEPKTTRKMLSHDIKIIMQKLGKAGVFSATLTGGEPTLCPEIVEVGIMAAKAFGLQECNINTNLQVLPDRLIEVFAEYKTRVLTSMLSYREEVHDQIAQSNGAHRRLSTNIRRLTDRGIKVSVNMVVRKENWSDVYSVGEYARHLGATMFSATKAAPTPGIKYTSYCAMPSQLKTTMDEMLRLKEDFGLNVDILESYPYCFLKDIGKYEYFARRSCTAGTFNCSISPTGWVRPCSHADMHYGSLLETSLEKAWGRMKAWRDGSLLHPICHECPHIYLCSGGCRMDAKILWNNIRGRDPLMTKPENVILPTNKLVLPLSEEMPAKVSLREGVWFRKEVFGGIVKHNYDIVLLSEDGYKTMKQLQNARALDWRSYSIPTQTPTEVEQFFRIMYAKQWLRAA